jgi:hypothetical protein
MVHYPPSPPNLPTGQTPEVLKTLRVSENQEAPCWQTRFALKRFL